MVNYGVLSNVDLLDWALSQTVSGTFLTTPTVTGVSEQSYYHGVLSVTGPERGLMLWHLDGKLQTRNTISGGWSGSDWVPYTTATPPQVFDLPLADGWTEHRASEYFKTQENIVTVYFQVHTSSPQGGEITLATLPEGFRPPNTIGGSGYCGITGEKYAPADVKVYPNGDITGFNDVGAAEYYTGFFTFGAAG